jgi:hypothetical protein
MANETKYQRQTKGFQQFRESLAFTPKQVGDEQARQRAANTKTFDDNYERDLLAADTSFKLLRSQQKMIDDANDKAAKMSREWGLQDFYAFSDLAQMGIHHMAAKEQRDDQKKAYSDFLELSKRPELLKKVMEPYRNNVKLNDENVRLMTKLGFELDSKGEELSLVKRVLNNGGHYNQNMLRLMKANVLEDIPVWMAQELNTKVGIPDHVFPGITEPISIEDIQKGGKYFEILQERDPDGSVQEYLNARASKGITDILSEWYSPEAVMADFQPAINKHFGLRDLSGTADAKAFWNSKTQKELRDVTVAEAKTLDPETFVRELIYDVESSAPYMGSVKEAFQTKLNQLLVAFENGEITLSTLRGIEQAIVNSKDHDKIGFEGAKEFGEWRKDNFGAVNWQTRIDQHIKAQGEKAKELRENAVVNLKGRIYQYKLAEKQAPPREIIQEWISSMDENGLLGGMSQFEAFDKATENMSTQQGDTIEQMKNDLTELLKSGPIQPEVVANYPQEIREWLEEKKGIADPAWAITSTMKTDIDKSLKALNIDLLESSGDYDQVLSRDMLRVNGTQWLSKEYKRQRAAGTPEHDAWQGPQGALAKWDKMVRENVGAWTVRRSTGEFTKKNTQSAILSYNQNGQNFNKVLPALETRVEAVAAHVRDGGRFDQNMTYLADDGNYYKVFDDTMVQLAATSGYTKGEILKQQLEDVGLIVGLDGEFKYLNADRRTQYIMERGGAGKIRAEVNASIKDSHLEELEINQDGGKPYLGLPMASLLRPGATDRNFEAITGISADYLNSVEPNGFKGVLDKLGIKSHERLSPKHIALIQKRVLSEHGAIALGTVDTGETSMASLAYNGSPENMTPGVESWFKNDPNQIHAELKDKRITHSSPKDKFTRIGTTRKVGLLGLTQVYGIHSDIGTRVHLGWRSPRSQKPWVQELMKTQNPYMNMDVSGRKPLKDDGVGF